MLGLAGQPCLQTLQQSLVPASTEPWLQPFLQAAWGGRGLWRDTSEPSFVPRICLSSRFVAGLQLSLGRSHEMHPLLSCFPPGFPERREGPWRLFAA